MKNVISFMLATSLVGCAGMNIPGPQQRTVDAATSAQVAQTPATEKLTAWNSEFRRDIIQVADNVYAASGYGASVFTMIEGTDGIIMVDTGQELDVSREALVEFRKITNKPVRAVIYTHGHGDHINGARAFVPVGNSDIQVWSAPDFNAEARAFQSSGITFAGRRGMRQGGFALPDELRINNGVAPAVTPTIGESAFNPSDIVTPNRTMSAERQRITVAGVTLELVQNPGETKDQLYVWYPDKRVVFAGDNFYKSWPNLYAIRGTPYRDVDEWARGIDALLSVDADHLVGGHTRPISGAANVKSTLTTYRDGVRSIFDQTIAGINKGMTPDELAATVKLPPELASADVLTPYYGNPEWAVRSIFNGYLGWFDGNPTNLFRLSPKEEAARMAQLAGGTDMLLKQAHMSFKQGDAQWTAQLCDYLIALDHETSTARSLKADALTQLGQDQITATARNYYLTVAQELREASRTEMK